MLSSGPLPQGRQAMKSIIFALITLSVLASIAGSASAFDAKTFYEQQDRARH
jgi:hypothetical protein